MTRPRIDRQIQVVFFDLGKVLLDFEWKILLKRAGWNPGSDLQILLDALSSENLMHNYETGQVSTEHFMNRLRGFMDFRGTTLELQLLWNEIFQPMDENIKIMRSIQERYPVGLISNINESHLDYVEKKYDFIHEIPERIYSCRTGARKPNSSIYRAALERLGVEPAHSLFIDDVEENVMGARRLGMHTIHYATGINLSEELRLFLEWE